MGLYNYLQSYPQDTRKNSEANFPKECHPRNSLSDPSSTSLPRSRGWWELLTYRNEVECDCPGVLRIQLLEYLCGERTGGVKTEGAEKQICSVGQFGSWFSLDGTSYYSFLLPQFNKRELHSQLTDRHSQWPHPWWQTGYVLTERRERQEPRTE